MVAAIGGGDMEIHQYLDHQLIDLTASRQKRCPQIRAAQGGAQGLDDCKRFLGMAQALLRGAQDTLCAGQAEQRVGLAGPLTDGAPSVQSWRQAGERFSGLSQGQQRLASAVEGGGQAVPVAEGLQELDRLIELVDRLPILAGGQRDAAQVGPRGRLVASI